MKSPNDAPIRRVTWAEVSEEVRLANPDLWGKLDHAMRKLEERTEQPYFFVATYPYGELLVKDGLFKLPGEPQDQVAGGDVPRALSYSPIPLCLVLDKCVEVFVERDAGYACPDNELRSKAKRNAPLRVIKRGELFGVFETLDTVNESGQQRRPPWSVSSGARTVIVLTQCGNKEMIGKLRSAVGADVPQGKERGDWELIRSVNDSKKFVGSRWQVRVLIFPSWITNKEDDLAFLQNIIYRSGWLQMIPIRDYLVEEADVAEFYIRDGASSKAKDGHELYHYFTVRHLLALSKGDLPSLNVARTEDEQAGPFAQFQRELFATGMMKYFPVILQPVSLSDETVIGFYSVSKPTLLAPVPNANPWSREKWKYLDGIALAVHALKSHRLEKALLDLERTKFFAKSRSNFSSRLNPVNEIDERELIPDAYVASLDVPPEEKKKGLNKEFTFFDGAVRIARR